jgi:L-ascorbate metabolism protein UlaG (beta-lactamase superfamily)
VLKSDLKTQEELMKITWLGHSGFRIEIADRVLLIDPWLTGNPVFPDGQREAAVRGATEIL